MKEYPHNPNLCDYLVMDTVLDDGPVVEALDDGPALAGAKVTLLAAPDEAAPAGSEGFDDDDTEVSMRTSMGYAASGRAPARPPDETAVLDLCPRCSAPLVTQATHPAVLAMLPVRCDGKCAL